MIASTLVLRILAASCACAVPLRAQAVPDSTSASRALAARVAIISAHQLETSLDTRLRLGLPMERLPDPSNAAAVAEGLWARQQIQALGRLPSVGLTQEERITLRVLAWLMQTTRDAPQYHWLSFESVTPYSSPIRGVTQALAALPLGTDADRARYRRVQAELPAYLLTIRKELSERAVRGIRLAAPEIPPVLRMLRAYRTAPEGSPFAPTAAQLVQIDSASRAPFETESRAVVAEHVTPALDSLLGVFDSSYVARAPKAIGLAQYPAGREYYGYLVRLHTTTALTPAEIHQIGLREVARVETEMAAIRREIGFTGTAQEFLAQMRRDPRWYATTPAEVGERLTKYLRRIEPEMPRMFSRLPRAKGDVRRLDPRLEPGQTFGYYDPPSASDSMGHYFYNGSSLAERPLMNAAALVYHEILPGHHFQFSLQLENAALPSFRRNSYQTAYTEGWGEYASRLAGEMGLLPDPYERYGRLLMDMFLSCRLVVDTGMNEFGWSRDAASAYMRARLIESPTQVASETLRYGTDLPGQALGYKIGVLEFLRLREKAKLELGAAFDLRAFHEVVLSSGSLPMTVLAWKVEQWIAAERARRN